MMSKTTFLLGRLARLISNNAQISELKPAQWEVLRYFAEANRFSRTPSAVTLYMGTTKGTISQTLQVLEQKKLVRKTAARNDKRSVTVDVTAAGRRLLKKDPLSELAQSVDSLSAEGRNALDTGVDELVRNLLQTRGGRPFGLCQTCTNFKKNHPEGQPHYCALLLEPLSESDSDMRCIEQQNANG